MRQHLRLRWHTDCISIWYIHTEYHTWWAHTHKQRVTWSRDIIALDFLRFLMPCNYTCQSSKLDIIKVLHHPKLLQDIQSCPEMSVPERISFVQVETVLSTWHSKLHIKKHDPPTIESTDRANQWVAGVNSARGLLRRVGLWSHLRQDADESSGDGEMFGQQGMFLIHLNLRGSVISMTRSPGENSEGGRDM